MLSKSLCEQRSFGAIDAKEDHRGVSCHLKYRQVRKWKWGILPLLRWSPLFRMRALYMGRYWVAHPTWINFRDWEFAPSSLIRMTSLVPPPPTASEIDSPASVLRWRKRLTQCMEPSWDAAKNTLSVTSQARWVIAWGNWKVVSNVPEERSQSWRFVSSGSQIW